MKDLPIIKSYFEAEVDLNRSKTFSISYASTDTKNDFIIVQRFLRATTVGPTSSEYISAMPFTYQAELAVERMIERGSRSYRATTVEPSSLYTRSYNSGAGYSAFDYKVIVVTISVTRLGDLLDFGQLLKPLATIYLPKSLTFLGNYCIGVKIIHFSS